MKFLAASATPPVRRRHRLPTRAGHLAGLALAALALASPATLGAKGRNIRFDRISIDQGLSQATVQCLLQDRDGFIWACTQDGLNRFDGYDFVVYKNDPADPRSIGNNWIQALVEDPSGDLWIATRGGGLARWQRASNTFLNYSHDPEDPASLSSIQVRAVFLDPGGILWVGTEQSGLNRLDTRATAEPRASFLHYRHDDSDPASLPDDQVRAVLGDRRGRLWVGTLAGGLARLDVDPERPEASRFTTYRHDSGDPASLSHDHVRLIHQDGAGALWIGTAGGLDRFDPATETFEHFRHDPDDPTSLSHNGIRAVYEAGEGRLWVATDSGLNLFDPAEGGFDRYHHDPADPGSLSNDRVLAVHQDRGGVLWFGTQGGGISRWDPRSWSFSNVSVRPSDLSGRDILSFAEDAEGRLWIGTSGHGLNRIDRESGEITHFRHDPEDPASLGDDTFTALYRDRRGTLWAGALTAGLHRYDAESETFTRFRHDPEDPQSLAGDTVTALFENRRNELWVGTFSGLSRFDRGRDGDAGAARFESFRHTDDPESLSDNRVVALTEDRRGALWVATLGGGLNRFDGTEGAACAFRRLRHDREQPDSLSSDGVLALYLSPTDVLWIGTQAGLNRLEAFDEATGVSTFRSYFQQDGLPNDYIYGIEPDGGGGLWLSTNWGLSRFDPRTETFKNYDTSHGLQANEFNFGAHYRSPSGELFFGGINGINAFYPDRIELNDRPPPVVLTGFSVLNRPVALDHPIFDLGRVELDYRDSLISFEFAALDYTAPERNRYRYRLEGFSDQWIELGNRRRVSFTNLDAGSYVLELQGSNNDGVWNEEGAEIRIAVAPPPWQTWWAYSLYALAFAAVVFGFVRSQQQKVERERQVNRRLQEVDELRGELLANLKSVVDERTAQVAERERLLAEVEAKNAELERFNYTVSHDLKSPLVTIKGFLGMLERDTEAGNHERARHDVRRIHAAADKMTQLLDELLHLSHMSHQTTEPMAVPLDEVAREALEAVTGAVGERGVEVEIAPDLPVVVGDRVRLRELYQNLFANAVKYMGDQPAPRVEAGIQWRGPETVYYVRDNGSGIEPCHHDKIFGLFERLETAEEGTGIGLALVKRIAEQHGGRAWVESEGKGRGSTFCFTLQQATASDGEAGGAVVMAGDRFRRGPAS